MSSLILLTLNLIKKKKKKLTYLFNKINPNPSFEGKRGRGHAAYEETKKRSSGWWECVIVFG